MSETMEQETRKLDEYDALAAKIELAIHEAARLGSDAFDFIEGRGLHQLRLSIAETVQSLRPTSRVLPPEDQEPAR